MNDEAKGGNAAITRHRSPAYPSVSLKEAVDRIKVFWKQYSRSPVPREVAMKKWGYESVTGSSARLVAALRQFGLISETENGIRITERGITLVTLPETNEEYRQALRDSLHEPKIYAEILSKYPVHAPDADLLNAVLVRVHLFNPNKTKEFIDDFMESVDFAKEYEDGEETGADKSVEDAEEHGSTQANRIERHKPQSDDMEKSFMCLSNEYALPTARLTLKLQADAPLTKEDIEMAEYYLDGFKKVIAAKLRRQETEGRTKQGSPEPPSDYA